jgi:cyanophycinase
MIQSNTPQAIAPARRSLAALLAMLTLGLVNHSAAAACLTGEAEPNNSDTTANSGLCSGTNINASLSSTSDTDWYRLDITTPGSVSVSLAHGSNADLDWYLYPATGTWLTRAASTKNPEMGSYNISSAGTYYVQVRSYSGSGSYGLNVTLPGSSSSFPCTLPAGVNLGKTGNSTPVASTTSGGIVLMGGGSDVTPAIKWMIGKAGGGDAVVIRSTGTNGYNSYIYGMGGLNSVQTLLIDSATEGNDACVAETIKRAGMLFITGGNQQNYIDYWKGKAVGNAINYLLNTKKAPVGGTSAGMAILSQYYHPGGAPDDATVLQKPTAIAIGNGFINTSQLANVVTDTHFSQRTRQPRLVSFLASSIYNHGATWQAMRGIACDEATAYAFDATGSGKVFGSNKCFFVKPTGAAEVLAPNTALTWLLGQKALNVQAIPGTATGTNTFNMSTWTGTGGIAQTWWVDRGVMTIR